MVCQGAAIEEPMRVAPTRNIWIHESLEDEARRVPGDEHLGVAARLPDARL